MSTDNGSGTDLSEQNDSSEEAAPASNKVLAALFKVEQETVDAIRKMVLDHHKETNGGLPTSEAAEAFCGDKKFTGNILFVVQKYLKGEIESRQGVGLCPVGAKCEKSVSRNIEPPSAEYMQKVRSFCVTCLHKAKDAGGKIQMSVKGIKSKALMNDMKVSEEDRLWDHSSEEPSDRKLQIAINLLAGEDGPFEIKAGDLKFRSKMFDPTATNKIPVPPGRKVSESNGAAAS